MSNQKFESIHDWIRVGIEHGYCTPDFCNTHEGDPYMTKQEEQEWDEGGDPCMVVVKLRTE